MRTRLKAVVAVVTGAAAVVAFLITYGPTLSKPFRSHHHVQPPRPAPLTLSADHDRGVLADGWIVVVPDRKRAAAAFKSGIHDCDSLWQAARSAGAADVGTTYAHVTAEGSGARTSTIVGIRARVLSRRPRTAGALADCPGGSAVGLIRMRLDLDSGDPVALRVVRDDHQEEGRVVGPFFADHAITVRRGESVPIIVEATTHSQFVVWKLEVTARVNGRRHTYVLDDNGQPFRTTARSSLELATPDYEWNWDPAANRLEIHEHFPGLGY
jgi:hypothetical protein